MKKLKWSLLIAMSTILFSVSAVSAKTIWVLAGANGNGTKDNPYGTIQKAADVAEAGDVVMICPGVYYEHVKMKNSGTKEKPIIFRASEYGEKKVIITGANKEIREKKLEWALEDEALGIYSIPCEAKPMRVLYNGANLVAVGNYNYLADQKYTGNGDHPTYSDGTYYDAEQKKLYVRLRDDEKYGSKNPNECLMCVSPQSYNSYTEGKVTYTGGNGDVIGEDSYNFGIFSENDAHVVLYGLTFETPGFTGVFVRANDVTVSNCWFLGCANGVAGGARGDYNDTYKSDRVTVEYCEWSAFPNGVEMFDMIKEGNINTLINTWQIKNQPYSINCYEVGSLVGRAGDGWVIRNNYVHDVLDALSFFAWGTYWERINGKGFSHDASDVEIYENRFENLLDNGIELEQHLHDVDIHHNEFVNNYEPVSSQPLNGWPWPYNVKFHHNYVWAEEEFIENYAQKAGSRTSIFKLCVNQINNWDYPWTKDEPFKVSPSRPSKTIWYMDKGLEFYNNTIYYPNAHFQTVSGRIGGDRGERSNGKFFNNIISCLVTSDEYAVKNGAFFDGAPGDVVSANTGYEFENNMFIPTNEKQKINPQTSAMKNGMAFYDYAEAGIPDIESGNIELAENSPAIGAGRQILGEKYSTEDIGALAYGEKWHIDYSPYPYGDVNCDGKVENSDALLIAACTGETEGGDSYESRCDLNFDGVIDSKDVELVLGELMNK